MAGCVATIVPRIWDISLNDTCIFSARCLVALNMVVSFSAGSELVIVLVSNVISGLVLRERVCHYEHIVQI